MNNESQNIEYKRIWLDENLKSVCAFANSQGGVMYIGIDDDGQVVGLDNIHKWQEDIPNKIVQNLGIVCAVNTHLCRLYKPRWVVFPSASSVQGYRKRQIVMPQAVQLVQPYNLTTLQPLMVQVVQVLMFLSKKF